MTLLQLRLALAVNKPLKFIRTSLKRLVASLPPVSATAAAAPSILAATFEALSFPARFEPTLCGASSASQSRPSGVGGNSQDALAAWRSVRELAHETGQVHVWVVAALAETRLVLLTGGLGELSTALILLEALQPHLGIDDDAVDPARQQQEQRQQPEPVPLAKKDASYPRSLRVMYRLMYCLVKSQTGAVKEAKAMLKVAHKMLDLELDQAERAEPDRVSVSPSRRSRSLLENLSSPGGGGGARSEEAFVRWAGRD